MTELKIDGWQVELTLTDKGTAVGLDITGKRSDINLEAAYVIFVVNWLQAWLKNQR